MTRGQVLDRADGAEAVAQVADRGVAELDRGDLAARASAIELADKAIIDAHTIGRRADALGGYALAADALADAIAELRAPICETGAPAWLAARVRKAAERAAEAAAMAGRAVDDLLDLLDQAPDADAARLFLDVSTARLDVALAHGRVGDAYLGGVAAARNLARLALAVALAEPDGETSGQTSGQAVARLAASARGVLRLEPTDGPVVDLADEHLEVWSVTLDELAMELAGLVAHLLIEHRRFLVIDVARAPIRYVQLLTYDRGLVVESISDRFLDEEHQLTDAERSLLLELGFEPPAEGDDGGSPNWSIEIDTPCDVHQVATLLLRTLTEVHGMASPNELAVTAAETTGPFASRRSAPDHQEDDEHELDVPDHDAYEDEYEHEDELVEDGFGDDEEDDDDA